MLICMPVKSVNLGVGDRVVGGGRVAGERLAVDGNTVLICMPAKSVNLGVGDRVVGGGRVAGERLAVDGRRMSSQWWAASRPQVPRHQCSGRM